MQSKARLLILKVYITYLFHCLLYRNNNEFYVKLIS